MLVYPLLVDKQNKQARVKSVSKDSLFSKSPEGQMCP